MESIAGFVEVYVTLDSFDGVYGTYSNSGLLRPYEIVKLHLHGKEVPAIYVGKVTPYLAKTKDIKGYYK